MAKVKISLPNNKMSNEEINRYLFELAGQLNFILTHIDSENLSDNLKEAIYSGTDN